MVKNLNKSILVIALTLAPTSQPLEARSYLPEVIGAAVVATCGLLYWKSQTNAHELAKQAERDKKEQADKNSINAVITLDPTRDLPEITQLLDQAQVSEKPFELFVAEYCSCNGLSIDALYSNLAAYTRQSEHAVVDLKTNYELWKTTLAPLAAQAYAALNDPRLQHNIKTLQTMLVSLQSAKEYVHIYCAHKQIATRSYPYDNDQFPLIGVIHDMNSDLETLAIISHKINALAGYDHDSYNHRTQLAHAVACTMSDLLSRKDSIVTSSEYQQQKAAHFMLQQKQEESDRVYSLEQQRLAQAKEADKKAYELEQQRINNERKALELKNREWDDLKASLKKLRDEIQNLTYEKNISQATINDLRLELARLREKYTALERERARTARPAD